LEKNLFIINLARQLPLIREKLGWTQEELARRLGLSRANIISLEQYPDKMGKSTALSLYTAVFGELSLKRRQYMALDLSRWDSGNPLAQAALLKQLHNIAWGRKRLAAVLVVGSGREALANKTADLIKLLNHPEALTGTALSATDLEAILERSLQYIENDICAHMGLESPDAGVYLNRLETIVYHLDGLELEFTIGDISAQDDMDIIVNATDANLSGSGGGDQALHEAAGPQLDEECQAHVPLQTGQAAATEAYWLPNYLLIHCAGPRYGLDEPAAELLADCYRNALGLGEEYARTNDYTSIAFPAISTGLGGYPVKRAARVALETVLQTLPALQAINKIRFVLFDSYTLNIFTKTWEALGQPQSTI